MAIVNEEFQIAAEAIQDNFCMHDFTKLVDTPDEAINVFKQLQPLMSKHGFELKKRITNCNKVINEIPEELGSISGTKQVKKEPSKLVKPRTNRNFVFLPMQLTTQCAQCAYLRSKPKEYSTDLQFVVGKCRAAPMRHLSIPLLELQAAVLAVRLNEYESKTQSCSSWTESATVLQWIQRSRRKQQVFAANRVAEILHTIDFSQWNHVSGINNPADIATRAINVEELKRSEWLPDRPG